MMTKRPVGNAAQPGDIARVAMRIGGISGVACVEGSHRVIRVPEAESLVPAQAIPNLSVGALEASRLVVRGEFSFRGYDGPLPEAGEFPEEKMFVEVSASFEIEYALEPGEPFSAEDANAFAIVNGMLNLQPFWREYVFSCLTRANSPLFVIPVFNPVRLMQEHTAKLKASPPNTPEG